MNRTARERRRSRILSIDEVVPTTEKKEEDPPKQEPFGIGSSARAKRRARNLDVDLENRRKQSLGKDWGSEYINFELLRQTIESYSGDRIDVSPRNEEVPDVNKGPTTKTKADGIRFSDEYEIREYENAKEKISKAQLDKVKGYLYQDDSPIKNRAKYNPSFMKLNRTSLEKLLLSESKSSLKKIGSTSWSDDKENYSYVKILATLLPDEILKDISGAGPKTFNAAVFFADVSGFTELSEKFDKTGKGGPSRLSEILNYHIGAMIQIVLSKRGDVCKFGGDAILCFWKAKSETNLKKAVCLAIDSALDIQKNCRNKSDLDVPMRIKITVAAGEVMFSAIGKSNRKYYVIVGKPVTETNRAEKLCRPGEVIVAPSAWKLVPNHLYYTHSLHSNRMHILVQDYGPFSIQAKTGDVPATDITTLNVRPSLKLAGNLQIEDLRPFILPFVMKCIDVDEPLDYLTEMRQVAIVFLKLNTEDLGLSPAETISFCDAAYKIVCGIVDGADGTVNKLTYFDKDVCILIVFGLRGFKYELASKSALKCAYSCLEKLRTSCKASASAGVTTGMAYCGVIGHLLRREYTVMGFPVNKAARLMCAYENIVSCDRETFLQSKLRAAHFDVLENKSLKGIRNVGPVYEYSLLLKNKRHNLKLDSRTRSLLGRSKEISEFEEFIKDYKKQNSIINFFVVYGGARIGKTRLISTFIQIAEKYLSEGDAVSVDGEDDAKIAEGKRNSSNIEICLIPLSEDDYKISYQTARLIFQPALGLSESSTAEEREEKILSKLGEVKDTYFLATLNPILNVKFGFSNNYLNLDQEERFLAKRLMKKRLFKICFPGEPKWLIVIDDAEFIDEASWVFLKWCCTISSQPLFLLAVGQQKALSASASECLLSIPQKKLVLTELDKWFYTALACQILEVKAIPVELEILLQGFKSSGNPGWLESYLLSLLQTGCLEVTYVTRREMNSMRLVAIEEETFSDNKTELSRRTESPYWLDWVESFKKKNSGQTEVVPVCVLGRNFVETYNESELTMDLMYVKTVDKLKPLEQVILKAGSVLGYNFRRDALNFIINKEVVVDERTFAKAIKNLFEIRILFCDEGDFTYPSSLIMNRRSILRDNFQKEIKCNCVGLVKSEALQNFPDYAACGFMRFRSPVLRDTVYNLLLDEQKRKFHHLSIEFFRNNTYRCKACRSVLFDGVFGREINNELQLVCAKTPMHGVRSTKIKFQRTSIKQGKVSLEEYDATSESSPGISLTDQTEENYLLNRNISDCQCPQILCTVYSALLEHAEGTGESRKMLPEMGIISTTQIMPDKFAGRKDIMLEVSLEYASVSLTSYNIPLTTQIVEDTLALARVIQEENQYPELCTPFIFGKIYTLMGATNLNMGKTDTALNLLQTALKYLGKIIPKGALETKMKMQRVNMENKLITECFPNKFIGKVNEKKAAHLDLLSECLGLMCTVYMYAKNWILAKFTSTWALNNALRSHRNFFGLCTSYANMMDVAFHYNDKVTSSKMELFAIDICEGCSQQRLELYELEAIAQLYKMIFRARHLRARIEDAIYIGFKSLRIATIIRNSSIRLDLMPDLIFALMQMCRLSEAVSLLQELEFASVQYCDKAGTAWYYTICMEFQLDTGYTILPYKACEKFVNEEEENFGIIRSIYAAERLCTSLWLWCIRNGEWEASKRYSILMKHHVSKNSMKTPSSVYIKLKKLEGFLITLVDKLDNRIVHTNMSISSEITTIMKHLEKDIKFVPLLKPRYLLMKAYYIQIKNRRSNVTDILEEAKSLADKMKDRNTVDWIIHNKLVWKNATTTAQKTFWNDHCKYDDFVDWHEAENTFGKEAFMFSLPLPNKP